MVLNDLGVIAHDQWLKLTERFTNIEFDVFQIMPNHMHGIIVINERAVANGANNRNDVGAGLAPAPKDANDKNAITINDANDSNFRAGASPARTGEAIGFIVGAYKSLVANGCLNLFKISNETMGKLWHRNYYEHIVRNERAYQAISDYIVNNPGKWIDDKFFIR